MLKNPRFEEPGLSWQQVSLLLDVLRGRLGSVGAPGKSPMNSWGSTPGKLKEHGAAGSVLGLAPPPPKPYEAPDANSA